MDFQDVVRRRRMVRRYERRAVPGEMVDRLVRNALRAPSAGFSQGWGFLVLDDPDDVARFRAAVTPAEDAQRWFAATFDAPVVIVPCANKDAYLDRYARPEKGAHRPLGRVVARSLLGHRHRVRRAADPADGGRPGVGGLLLRRADRPHRCVSPSVRRAAAVPPDRSDLRRLSGRAAD